MTSEEFLKLPVEERARLLINDRGNCPLVEEPFTPDEFRDLPIGQRLRIWNMDPGTDYGVDAYDLMIEAADSLDNAKEQHGETRDVLRALLLRVHWVAHHPLVSNLFATNAVRSGQQYSGPTWQDAFDAALRLFKRTELPVPSYPVPEYGAYHMGDFHNPDAQPVFTGTAADVIAWIQSQSNEFRLHFTAPTKRHFSGNSFEDFCAEVDLDGRNDSK